ncbi:MAG: cytidine deaminase [Gemmataceae bacterium]
MRDCTRRQLLELARRAAQRAYCPYSRFPVGAALLGEDGFLILGANVENASYGLTNCAERTAIFAAATAGMRQLRALAVACMASPADAPESTRMPCGACRQVIAEFATPQTEILIDGVGSRTIEQLLPGAFVLRRDRCVLHRPIPSLCWHAPPPDQVPPRYTLDTAAGRLLALVTPKADEAETAAMNGLHAFHLGGPDGRFHHGVASASEVWAILDALVYTPSV